ncbi:MAG: hypothetical protein ACMXYG_07550 [Candidatus Woesearchaeota archaeon]
MKKRINQFYQEYLRLLHTFQNFIFLDSSNLNSAMKFIKEQEFDNARLKINNAKFWSNNSLTISIITYILVGICLFLIYRKYQDKPKNIKKIRPHHISYKKHK